MGKISFPTIDLIRDYFDDDQIYNFLKLDGCVNGEIDLYSRNCKGKSWYKEINCDVSKPLYKMMKKMQPKYMGIDIPVLISKPGNTETVMFIARDPQRNKDQVFCDNMPEEKIFIGTPFGIEIQECSELYKSYINQILESGINMYITDIYKFFTNQGSGSDFSKYNIEEISKNPVELIIKEFQFLSDNFDCKKIICIHSDSKAIIKKYLPKSISAEILEGPHPIGSRYWNAERKSKIPGDTITIITAPEKKNYLIKPERKFSTSNSLLSDTTKDQVRAKLISKGLINTKQESVFINKILDQTNGKKILVKYTFEKDRLGINVYWNIAETVHNEDIMNKILEIQGKKEKS